MTYLTPDQRKERLARMLAYRKQGKNNTEIARLEKISPERVRQLIGNYGRAGRPISVRYLHVSAHAQKPATRSRRKIRKFKTPMDPVHLRKIYDFMADYLEKYGVSPTVREIGRHFGVTWGGVSHWLEHMEAQGMIERTPGRMRNIRLVPLNQPEAMES